MVGKWSGVQEIKPAPSASAAAGTWQPTFSLGRLFVTVPRTLAQHDFISKELIQPLPREMGKKACRSGVEDMEDSANTRSSQVRATVLHCKPGATATT